MSSDYNVTRFEVIDEAGRVLSRLGVCVELSYQDEGRTLKVFLRNTGTAEEVADEMARGLARAIRRSSRHVTAEPA